MGRYANPKMPKKIAKVTITWPVPWSRYQAPMCSRGSPRPGHGLAVLIGKQSDEAFDAVVAHLLAERGPVIRRQADPANADIEDFPARRGLFHCVIDGDRLD